MWSPCTPARRSAGSPLAHFELKPLKNYTGAWRRPPEHVAVRVLLQQRLAEVLAEQDSRNRLHQANGQTLL